MTFTDNELYYKYIKACNDGDFSAAIETIKVCEEYGTPINLTTLLENACKYGQLETVQFIFSKCEPFQFNFSRAFYSACANNQMEIIKFLVNRGIGGYTLNKLGFELGCKYGHLPIIYFFIHRGINHYNAGLLIVCQTNSYLNKHKFDIAQLMISKAKEGGNFIDFDQALEHASCGGDIDLVKLMITNGATHFDSCISFASVLNHKEVVLYLVEKGASVEHLYTDQIIYLLNHGINAKLFKHFNSSNRTTRQNFITQALSLYLCNDIIKYILISYVMY